MLFSTTIFLFAFLPCVLFGYYVLFRNNRKWQNIFLTFCSLFFYAWGEPWFVLVMLGSIICNWAFALWVDKRKDKQKPIIILTLVLNLGIMFVFKYLTFVLENINNVVGGITVPIIELPIGISFFTFQALSYVLDICRGKGKAQKNPLNVALYISFFPQLIAGPIVRYETVAEQIQNRKETIHDFNEGTCRFIIGLSKKVILANNLAIVADAAFSSGERSVTFAWLGLIAYTFQIFFDFSGYSDMAIGLGKMFGFHFLENFNYPYIAKSISDFWRRWHISLGTWFRDYVYFPLGGSRVKTKWKLVFNLFVVWLLTGIWHGANWTFILWGLIFFIFIMIEKLIYFDQKNVGILGHIYVLFIVICNWVLFRSDNIANALQYLKSMFLIGNTIIFDSLALQYLKSHSIYFIIATFISMPIMKKYNFKSKRKIIHQICIILIFILSIASILNSSFNPFIYYNF